MSQDSGEQRTPICIATRASRLAMWQADYTAQLLRRHSPGCQVELVQISTTGDRDRMTSLNSFGGVGVFTREIQNALLDGRADLAVHSLKDLPTEPHELLVLAAIPQRASIFDALVLPKTAQPAADLDSSRGRGQEDGPARSEHRLGDAAGEHAGRLPELPPAAMGGQLLRAV